MGRHCMIGLRILSFPSPTAGRPGLRLYPRGMRLKVSVRMAAWRIPLPQPFASPIAEPLLYRDDQVLAAYWLRRPRPTSASTTAKVLARSSGNGWRADRYIAKARMSNIGLANLRQSSPC
jgi:hypothetical protein